MASSTPAVVLRRGRDKSLRRGHPWVFSGSVDSVSGDPQAGDTVQVLGQSGEMLGVGAYSPASQIRVRLWTTGEAASDGRFDAEETISERIRRAAERRRGLESCTDAQRIAFSEADGLPGVVADRYGEVVVVQLGSAGADRWRDVIADALLGLPGVSCVFERSDADVRRREGLPERVGVLRGALTPGELTVHEHGLSYAVDVTAGHKTGFYIDQRDARWLVGVVARSRRVLNVFSYTGSMSVAALVGGASAVTNVDSSGPALAIARRNGELNGVDIGELVEADAFLELRALRDRARQFDLILLDPPKLAATEAHVPKATRAYKDLNLLAIKLLAPGGTLLTWSCSGAMTMDLFQKVVAGAALDARREVRITGRLHQPSDHPVPLWFPEAEYLKGLVLQAD